MSATEPTELRLTLDGYFPPNPNRTSGRHFRAIKQEKDRAFQYVTAAYLNTEPRVQFVGPVKITIIREWGHRQRAMDKDNLYAACKFLVDALRESNRAEQTRRLAIIEDDDPDSVELTVEQRPAEKDANGERQEKAIIVIEGAARDVVPA